MGTHEFNEVFEAGKRKGTLEMHIRVQTAINKIKDMTSLEKKKEYGAIHSLTCLEMELGRRS